MTDCLVGLDALATRVPPSVNIVVWLNEYFGPVSAGGKQFEDMQVYKDQADRIFGVVTLHQRSELFIADTQRMLEQHQTFADIIDDKKITFMSRHRLRIVRDEVSQSLSTTGTLQEDLKKNLKRNQKRERERNILLSLITLSNLVLIITLATILL